MYNERNSKGFDRTYQALSREGPGFGTGNNQFNQDPNFGPPNSNSIYNERNSKGIDRTYQHKVEKMLALVQVIISLIKTQTLVLLILIQCTMNATQKAQKALIGHTKH